MINKIEKLVNVESNDNKQSNVCSTVDRNNEDSEDCINDEDLKQPVTKVTACENKKWRRQPQQWRQW